ncbi:hypothetical protein [Streptomyces radicis]|uniref:hypothetical protein n=1 Tax=Streptomyces radicis TaxID=1750517 RepID=UPI0011C4A960|nr:hypothetical protein [Streptomyces radicis]
MSVSHRSHRSRGVRTSAVVVGALMAIGLFGSTVGASSASAEQQSASAGCYVEVYYEGRWIKVKVDC